MKKAVMEKERKKAISKLKFADRNLTIIMTDESAKEEKIGEALGVWSAIHAIREVMKTLEAL